MAHQEMFSVGAESSNRTKLPQPCVSLLQSHHSIFAPDMYQKGLYIRVPQYKCGTSRSVSYTCIGNIPGIGDIMAQPAAILGFLAVVLVLFIIVFVIMFIGFKRTGQWKRTEEQRERTEPVIGTERGPHSGPQQIHYHDTGDAMNEDVGGNLARVPKNNRGDRDTTR